MPVSDRVLGLLGLMRRARALEAGENNSGAAVKAGKAKILLLASDASDNARRRAETFVYGHSTVLVRLPHTKEELSSSLGVGECAMAAVTDMGFANALMKALEAESPGCCSAEAAETERRFQKAERRKRETAAQENNKRNGKKGGLT